MMKQDKMWMKNGYIQINKKSWKKRVGVLLISVMLLPGCGKQTKIPELLEPLANNQSFRPVTREDIGQIDIKIADVVPEEYCYFSKNAMEILDIEVDLGDYVEAGQVLATVDVAEQQQEIEGLQRTLKLKKDLGKNNKKIAEENMELLKLQEKIAKESKDTKAEKELATQIQVEEENLRCDNLLAKHQERCLQEQIQDLEKDVETGTIRATHSGYVTFVKDMSENNQVNGMENIVIVSDYNQLHFELSEDINSTFYKQNMQRYDRIYTTMNGKECDVTPYAYSNEQLMAVQGAQAWPNIRFDMEGEMTGLQPGDKLPLLFTSNAKKNVLTIGTDSLYNEGDSYFVYVQKGKEREKRAVEIGFKNTLSVEITKGLSEGEWVYYSSDSLMPSAYEEVPVHKQVFGEKQDGEVLQGVVTYTRLHSYLQREEAAVEAVYFQKGDMVKKGDLICVLDLESGGAALKEQRQALENCEAGYKEQKKEMEKQISNLEKEINKVEEGKKKLETKQQENIKRQGELRQQGEEKSREGANSVEGTYTTEETSPGEGENPPEGMNSGDGINESAEFIPEEGIDPAELMRQEEELRRQEISDIQKELEQQEISKQQLICEKHILEYEIKNLKLQYEFDKRNMQLQCQRLAKDNDGNGKRSVYAKQDGVIGKLNIYQGKTIHPQEDGLLFQVCDESSKKLAVRTGEVYVGVGNEATFTLGSDKETSYKEKIVGNSGIMGKVYLTEKNGKIYVTQCGEGSGGGNCFYLPLEEIDIADTIKTGDVQYSKARMTDVTVVPSELVVSEVNKWNQNEVYYFVWKVVDGVLVKQYITMDETLISPTETCVLSGLTEGDILAKQLVEK